MGRLRRRRFLTALCAIALADPLVCLGQRPSRTPRIGILSQDSATAFIAGQQREFLHDSLRRAGYKLDKDIVLEWRFAEGKTERLGHLAHELIRLKVSLIVVPSSVEATLAAKDASSGTPIVMHQFPGDPVQLSIVASLARPGGNVTGTTSADINELISKQYQILKEAAPATVRVAALYVPSIPGAFDQAKFNDRMNALRIVVTGFPITRPDEAPAALQRIAAFKPDALFVDTSPVVRARFADVVAFAAEQKLVTMSTGLNGVRGGLLLYYGPDLPYTWDRSVSYIDRILRGTEPGDLPVEQPTKYELVFNAKTAQAIGYTLPSTLQTRVDRILK